MTYIDETKNGEQNDENEEKTTSNPRDRCWSERLWHRVANKIGNEDYRRTDD
jgi:hypothetical protein